MKCRLKRVAESWEEVVELIECGQIEFSSNHDYDAMGPMTGTISATMSVLIVKNEPFGNTCFGRVVEPKVHGVFDEDSRNK